jgi:hypothetical protein
MSGASVANRTETCVRQGIRLGVNLAGACGANAICIVQLELLHIEVAGTYDTHARRDVPRHGVHNKQTGGSFSPLMRAWRHDGCLHASHWHADQNVGHRL